MHTKLPTIGDRLSPEPITLPPRKKSKTTFGSLVIDSKEDEEWTYWNDIEGGRGEELNATSTQGNIEEKLEPNLHQVIDNIQIELVMSTEPVLPIVKSSQPIQHVVEPMQMENP